MLDASRGLEYMHRVGYIHGNVKSVWVLPDLMHVFYRLRNAIVERSC